MLARYADGRESHLVGYDRIVILARAVQTVAIRWVEATGAAGVGPGRMAKAGEWASTTVTDTKRATTAAVLLLVVVLAVVFVAGRYIL